MACNNNMYCNDEYQNLITKTDSSLIADDLHNNSNVVPEITCV